MAFRLILLGPPRLADAEGRPVAFPAKGLVLAAHLILSREGYAMPRPEAAALLWEQADAAHAALNFRQLASRIRARQVELSLPMMALDGPVARLDPDAAAVDVMRFQRLVARPEPGHLGELCALYGGDFLQGTEVEGEDCRGRIETQRARLRAMFVEEACAQLEAPAALEPEAARSAAERVLEVDPYNERALRALVLALGRANRPALARDAYDSFTLRLRRDLGVDPEVETAGLAAIICGARSRKGADKIKPLATTPSERRDAARPWPRVMVLPCREMVSGSEAGRFAGSLIADVTISLCAMRTLTPIAPHTAWAVGEAGGESDLAGRFALDFLVECRLTDHVGEAALFVQLVRAVSREILWAERFALKLDAAETSYRHLANAVARAIVSSIERTELARFARERDPGAYANYLMGQQQLGAVDLPRVRRARKFFHAAIAASPDFAAAHSGLARTCHLEWLLLARRDPEILEQAITHADRAVALDPDDARGHRELGVAKLYAGAFDDSMAAFSAAETVGPSHADVLADYADTLVHAADLQGAADRIEKAIELNPLCPDDYWWTAGGAYYLLGDYRKSIDALRRMTDRRPASRLMAASFAMLGERAEARRCVRAVREDHPNFSVERWLSILPMRDPQRRAHYEQGLRLAGFE
jgi:DNA-binding SARP family transcriptional activator/tetratricopeptide (TPR) repeat protein